MKCANCNKQTLIETADGKKRICTNCGMSVKVTSRGENIYSPEVIKDLADKVTDELRARKKAKVKPPPPPPPPDDDEDDDPDEEDADDF